MPHSDLVAGAGYPFPSRVDLVVRASYASALLELAALFFSGRLNSSYAAARGLELRTDLSDASTRIVLPEHTSTSAAPFTHIPASASTLTPHVDSRSLFVRHGNESHAEMAPLWLLRARFHLSRLTVLIESARDTFAPTPFTLSSAPSSQAGALLGGALGLGELSSYYPQPTLNPLLARAWARSGLVELAPLPLAAGAAPEHVRYALRAHVSLLRLLPDDFLVARYPEAFSLSLNASSDRTLRMSISGIPRILVYFLFSVCSASLSCFV